MEIKLSLKEKVIAFAKKHKKSLILVGIGLAAGLLLGIC